MKKYAGILSIFLTLIGLSPLVVGLFVEGFIDYFLFLFLPTIILSLGFAVWSEQGTLKDSALLLGGTSTFMTLGTFLMVTFFF